MTKLNAQRGFTLVELAIVLTIIGLLLGGILKGRQLMQNARVTATLAQISAIEAATTTFLDTQGVLPGDMVDASVRIPNCTNCKNSAATGGGNGKVGNPTWNLQTTQSPASLTDPANSEGGETILYWVEMAQSGLLGGVSYNGDAAGMAAGPVFGTHAPSARIGGGFIVGYANGSAAQFNAPAIGPGVTRLSGTVLMLMPSVAVDPVGTAAGQVIDPSVAGQIDRKFDDGLALTGRAQGSGADSNTAGCFTVGATETPYSEQLTARHCDMFFQIAG